MRKAATGQASLRRLPLWEIMTKFSALTMEDPGGCNMSIHIFMNIIQMLVSVTIIGF
jgi:hypothetical protein